MTIGFPPLLGKYYHSVENHRKTTFSINIIFPVTRYKLQELIIAKSKV